MDIQGKHDEPDNEQRLDAAIAAVADDPSLEPPASLHFVGDGDFRAIATEHLRYFVRNAGLRPADKVLEIGCGVGRMAVGLSLFLDPVRGEYVGFDPVAEGIEWCDTVLRARSPRFTFLHADLQNDLYNPGGAILPQSYRFPANDGQVDFAVATSIFTHLRDAEVAHYASELNRVLAPNSGAFLTAYLFDGERPPSDIKVPHLRFDRPSSDQPDRWHVSGLPDLAAVAYRRSHFEALFAPLAGRMEIRAGRWRGGDGPWFQDAAMMVRG